MLKEFKEFAMRGNVLDMAVGVVIGGAFGKIVTSLVNDLIMPVIGWLTAGGSLSALKWVISPAIMEGETVVRAEAAILYGSFIQTVLDFLIIAFSVFIFVRAANKARAALEKPQEAAPEPEPEPEGPTEAELLSEILEQLRKAGQ